MKETELVLFDLDGTLIDTIDLIYLSFKHATTIVLNEDLSREKLLRNIGRPLLDQMKVFSEEKKEDLMSTYHEYNFKNHDRMVSAYPGVPKVLGALSKSSRIGVVTSKRRDLALRGIELCGLSGYIEKVVAMEDTTEHKPGPAPVLLALKEFDIKKEKSIFIGDSPFDIQAGKAAGVEAVGVTWGPFSKKELLKNKPDHIIDQIEELLKITG